MFDRVKRAVAIGLVFAAMYSAYVCLLYLIRGAEPFQRLGTSLGIVVATYAAGGISAGVVVGILQPLARTRFGAMGVGSIAAFFVLFGVGVAIYGPVPKWQVGDWMTLVALAIVFGTLVGYNFWKEPIP